ILVPCRANGGRVAVTITAATFFTCSCRGFTLSTIPRRFSRLITLCGVNTDCWLSPDPFSPATSPYPDSWFGRTPSIVAISLSRADRTTPGANTTTALARTNDTDAQDRKEAGAERRRPGRRGLGASEARRARQRPSTARAPRFF